MSESLGSARFPSDDDRPWHAVWGDKIVRWSEKRHQEKSEGIPSAEAIDEAVAYYSSLHNGKAHDPVLFKKLLDRRGLPDWANPYPIGPERALLHEEGFLWADVQVLVEDLLAKASGPSTLQDQEDEDANKLRIHHAQICWMMILQETSGAWPRSLMAIHPDNLTAITLEAMLNPHLAAWGIDPGNWKNTDLLG